MKLWRQTHWFVVLVADENARKMFPAMCNNILLFTWCIAGHANQLNAPEGGSLGGAAGAPVHVRGEKCRQKYN
jgi:hypothetical protein